MVAARPSPASKECIPSQPLDGGLSISAHRSNRLMSMPPRTFMRLLSKIAMLAFSINRVSTGRFGRADSPTKGLYDIRNRFCAVNRKQEKQEKQEGVDS